MQHPHATTVPGFKFGWQVSNAAITSSLPNDFLANCVLMKALQSESSVNSKTSVRRYLSPKLDRFRMLGGCSAAEPDRAAVGLLLGSRPPKMQKTQQTRRILLPDRRSIPRWGRE